MPVSLQFGPSFSKMFMNIYSTTSKYHLPLHHQHVEVGRMEWEMSACGKLFENKSLSWRIQQGCQESPEKNFSPLQFVWWVIFKLIFCIITFLYCVDCQPAVSFLWLNCTYFSWQFEWHEAFRNLENPVLWIQLKIALILVKCVLLETNICQYGFILISKRGGVQQILIDRHVSWLLLKL